jgi:glycine/D-amino acid oxidase-like deaminating enzyme
VRVAVVGAGAVGATAARDLAARGAEVHVFERSASADGATPRAAGIVYDAFARDIDARVAGRAMDRFRDLAADDDFALAPCPYVWLAREADDVRTEAIEGSVDGMRANGRAVELLDPDELAARFPAVRTGDVAVAAVAANAGHCDARSYAAAMLRRAERAGAILHADHPVAVAADPPRVPGAPTDRGYDAVLVAAGARSKRLLADAGIAIPCKPYRVQALTAAVSPVDGSGAGTDGDVADGDPFDRPTVYDATAGFYCRPHPEGLLAGDGTEAREADPDGYDPDGDPDFEASTVERLEQRLDVAVSLRRSWAGLCTATPDRDPLLGAVADGVYVATGFHGHGFMRSPALGETVAGAILDGEAAPIDPFDPSRFDGDETFRVVEGMVIDE